MYSIPKDGDIVLAIRNVLARYKAVRSQRELREKVEQELNFGGGNFHVGEQRVRQLAVVSGVAKLKVHTRSTHKPGKMNGCPVCGSKLTKHRNMTVFGDTITTGYRCSKCEYWTESYNMRMPSRYEFSLRRRK